MPFQPQELSQKEKMFFDTLTADDLKNFELVVFISNPRTIVSKKTNQNLTVFTGKLKYKGHEICNVNLFENIAKSSGKKFLSGKGAEVFTENKTKQMSFEIPSKKEVSFEDIPF